MKARTRRGPHKFFREAEMAGRLSHPYIVTIYDAGEDSGSAYIAMELLRGKHLVEYTDPSRLLPPAIAIEIMARLADALHYAHQNQVVHRDIKPANIMFDAPSGELKITDFGIARLTDSGRTRTGVVLGTPSFMSPEQLQGRPVTGRSDLFALAVSLFQLLTGQLPFRARFDAGPDAAHRAGAAPAHPRPEPAPARGSRRVFRSRARQGPGRSVSIPGPSSRRRCATSTRRPRADADAPERQAALRRRDGHRSDPRAQRGHVRHRCRHRSRGAGRRHGRLQGRRSGERHHRAHRHGPDEGSRRARGPGGQRRRHRPEPARHPVARRDPARQQADQPDRQDAAELRGHGHHGRRRPLFRRQADDRPRRRLAAVPLPRAASSSRSRRTTRCCRSSCRAASTRRKRRSALQPRIM